MEKQSMSSRKRTKGRQKIPINRLIDESSRQVTFSKRREGLYNKASELCILTAARIAVITFSPNVRRPFCFTHPEMDTILEAYLGGTATHPLLLEKVFKEEEARIEEVCREPRRQCEAARLHLEAALNSNIHTQSSSSAAAGAFWWDDVCVEMVDDVEELEEFAKALNDVKNNLRKRCNQPMMMMMTNGGSGGGDHHAIMSSTATNTDHHHHHQTSASSDDHDHHNYDDGSADHFDCRLLGFGDADYLHNWSFG